MITKVPFLVSEEDGDAETLKANLHHLRMRLRRSGFGCDGLETLCIKDLSIDTDGAEKIIGWALSDHATRNPHPGPNPKINLSLDSIKFGIGLLKARLSESAFSNKYRKDIAIEKDFLKRLSSDVIPPNLIGVKFDDIGALQNLKDSFKELVIFPFQRPQLSCKRKLTEMQLCKGILLYGPPGTGKTMLAKAVAVEAGANFIDISMSSITYNKLFGEVDKYIKAVFSLASKKSPCVIFLEEVDSMLGRRESPGATLEIKNAFMKHWAGLSKKEKERVLVLAATTRPFDLDEAVTGQFCRRFLVELPDAESRSQILKVILRKTTLSDDVDLVRLARMTNGYSGKDLKVKFLFILCYDVSAKIYNAEGKIPPALHGSYDIRALNMQDFIYTLEKVCASIKSESVGMKELQQWNERYGEGGSRKRTRDGCVMQY
ncbi:hypothetical protein F2Q69_00057328 [Brassica cretica]|uniref:AAA+ ATPase domain-containing protein n=1 Tax=Brassica cretica TaxID=69181 RepID=A0A8S9MV56_BRACR|nr:hypothetical protein F2Q69_00057328 [Brassica cretica]